MAYQTYALWGRGDIAQTNALVLLEEYVPDNVGTVYRPEVIDRKHKGLRTVLDWFESDDFLGQNGALPTVDLIQSLLDERNENGDEVFLLALWPEDPTNEEFDFIEAVQAQNIMVIDMCRAMDELDLSLYSRPVPTREEKAEARAAAAEVKAEAKRARSRKLSDEVTTESKSEPVTTESTSEEPSDADLVREVIEDMFTGEELGAAILQAIDVYVENKVMEILARRAVEQAEKAEYIRKQADRPPFEPPYVDEHTKPYFRNASGALRPAVGKPRRGEILVNLTPEEVPSE